jgi:dolichol-phosphate mannosyltransferase
MGNWIVLPTYNESQNLEKLVDAIFKLHDDFNFIIVDDNSPDGTGRIADALAQKDTRVSVIHRPSKSGLGTAYVCGFKEALAKGAELIFTMDADFSHNPLYLSDFLRTAENADLSIGSRYVDGVRVEGWRFRRLLLSKFANIFISYVLVRPIWDFTAGFRCYRRKVLEAIDLDDVRSDGYAFQIEMTYLACENGFRVIEIPILFREREHGCSKLSKGVVWEAFWLTLKCHAPITKIMRHMSFLFKDYRDFTGTCR